ALALPFLRPYWAGIAAAVIWFTFPFPLLCTMSAASPWMLVDVNLVTKLALKPQVAAFLYLNCVILFVPCAAVGYFLISRQYLWLGPLVGFVWSWALMSHARVIGRAGWALTNELSRPRAKKKKRRSRQATRG